jgi:lipoate---protein ligase
VSEGSRFEEFRHRWSEYEWRVIRGEKVAPPVNHALDEVFARRAGSGESAPSLRIWDRFEPEVPFGRFQSLSNEVDLDNAGKHGVSLVRRMTGGGAMFVEPEDVITYSITAPADLVSGMSAVESYGFLDEWVVEALRSLGVEAYHEPINDISSEDGKIGGSAQARSFGAVLHHTTLAYELDARKMLEVLRIGKEKASDKAVRSAEKRVGPIKRQTHLSKEEVISALTKTFAGYANGNVRTDIVSQEEMEEAEKLVESRYGTREWNEMIP